MYRIALNYPYTDASNVLLFRGINAYAHQHPIFEFRYFAESDESGLEELIQWKGDGAILGLQTQEAFEQVKRAKLAVVNTSGAVDNVTVPRVYRDQREIGVQAAQYLAGLGVNQLAYVGLKEKYYSQLKWQAFQKTSEELIKPSSCFWIDSLSGLSMEEKMLRKFRYWLKKLQPPVGILLDRDALYGFLHQACIQGGLRIPEDIAVIGVNNSKACNYHQVPLSSYQFINDEYGIRVMQTLHALIENRASPEDLDVSILGVELFERESTDVLHCDDPRLSQAVSYIKANVEEPFTIDNLLDELNCSRRTLENAIRKDMKCTLRDFIIQERIKRVKNLLKFNRFMDPHRLASRAGFTSARHLKDVFVKHEGCSLEEHSIKLGAI
ncbi:MAG: substrate-binding domain-containing protein [Verrucomicrobiota bacterium]